MPRKETPIQEHVLPEALALPAGAGGSEQGLATITVVQDELTGKRPGR
jgi:hypothetical protein